MSSKKGYCPKCGNEVKPTNDKAISGNRRYRCSLGHRTTRPLGKKPVLVKGLNKKDVKGKRFVITSAQNDTAIHKPTFDALLTYCKENDAQLLVIPTPYNNTDIFHIATKDHYTWPTELTPYLINKRIDLCPSLTLAGDIHIRPTTVRPTSGQEVTTGHKSMIIGHPKLQMKMVATPKNKMPKMVHTTGSLSVANYTQSAAGSKAEVHHHLGALVVETQGKKFWVRQLSTDKKGGFYDLDKYYFGNKVTKNHRLEGLVYGDLHVKFLTEIIARASFFGDKSIKGKLRPKHQVFHDLHDHYCQSHHHERDTLLKVKKFIDGDLCVKAELDMAVDFLNKVGGGHIIESNHHDHLRQWLNRYKPNIDPQNFGVASELGVLVHDDLVQGNGGDPFQLYLKKHCKAKLNFVSPNDDFTVAGIDCSQHGDRGANGSRPSPLAFARACYKMIAGHSHTPCIMEGFWQTGISSPDMAYAKGLSSWFVTHGGIYPNGKRVLLSIIDGLWRPSWAI